MNTNRKTLLIVAFCATACSQPGLAQAAPPTILRVDLQNQVEYVYDVGDPLKFATDPGVTTRVSTTNFIAGVIMSDVVAVNGQPVKGTRVFREHVYRLRPDPTSGQAISDIVANAVGEDMLQILKPDGTQIGTIFGAGLLGSGAGTPPPAPGAPLAAMANNVAVVGGTGAFLGARGVMGLAASFAPLRAASITEDPSNRRSVTAGKGQWVVYLIPMERPEIATTPNGPAVTHSGDFSFVTASKPAAAGEILSLFITGLGPTVPGVDPGKPFPSSPVAVVNSPVDVTVNGKSAEVLAAVGFPGAVDGYQVNFRVPSETAKGPASVQVSAAWIAGPAVSITVQ